jgi:hypothetical protein
MLETKGKAGRPKKHHTEEDRRAAASEYKKKSRRRRQKQQAAGDNTLQIQFDPHSILQQPGPGESGQITAPDHRTQAAGLSLSIEEQQLLQVAI